MSEFGRPMSLQFWIFSVFTALWTMLFIADLVKMAMARAFNTWYMNYNNDNESPLELRAAFKTSLTWHWPTIAFGALTVNILRIPRIIFGLVPCWKKFLRRFSSNAYIMCAIRGKGFLKIGSDAHEVMSPHFGRYFQLKCVTSAVFGIPKFLVVSVTIYLHDRNTMHWIPLVVVFIYLVADMFFAVNSTSVDTMIFSYRKCQFMKLFFDGNCSPNQALCED